MGIDSRLAINSKYDLRQIKLLIEGLGYKIKKTDLLDDHSFVTVDVGTENAVWLYVARTTLGGIDVNYLSARSNDNTLKLLKGIASVTGGLLNEADCDSNFEEFQSPHDGNVRFILEHTILRDAIKDSDKIGDAVSEAIGYEKGKK